MNIKKFNIDLLKALKDTKKGESDPFDKLLKKYFSKEMRQEEKNKKRKEETKWSLRVISGEEFDELYNSERNKRMQKDMIGLIGTGLRDADEYLPSNIIAFNGTLFVKGIYENGN